ncbi:MAG: glycosyltransferase family 4 protein [Pseudomonadota bacterium]
MKILLISSLFPNAEQPSLGVFVQARLRKLLAAYGDIEVTVVAPIPWFPFKSDLFGDYAKFARAPEVEEQYGFTVYHPRYPVIPKVGMSIAPGLMYRSIRKFVAALHAEKAFDLIDGHYFYPDGVAVSRIATELGLPFALTARGTDITLIPKFEKPRQQILEAAAKTDVMISVCQALKDEMVSIGIDGSKIEVLRNGVDLSFFRPLDASPTVIDVSAMPRILVSVGYLIERKGHDKTIAALPDLPDCHLIIAGDGPLLQALQEQAAELGVSERVHFVGSQPQEELVRLYNAADCLVLMSSREGMANVLLESLACGTPVVVSQVWGAPEVVKDPVAGRLVKDFEQPTLVSAIRDLFTNAMTRDAVREYAEQYDWQATSKGQRQLFDKMVTDRRMSMSTTQTSRA